MNPTPIEIAASACFIGAILHTFSVKRFQVLALKYRPGTFGENFFHLLGEVEIVFGFWAAILLTLMLVVSGKSATAHYLNGVDFTEPAFVFVVMAIAATRPVLYIAERIITLIAKLIPLKGEGSFYLTALVVGPLLGSFITEPAAMTLTALLMKERFFDRKLSERFQYLTLAVLFVNVSIGGVLTHFAAPPVIMVAIPWGWDMPFMMSHFGWKALIAVIVNASFGYFFFRAKLGALAPIAETSENSLKVPWALVVVHLLFLAGVVVCAHHMKFFAGLFLFFIGFTSITKEYQSELKVRESLLVGFFLAGLVTLGGLQHWWLEPLISQLSSFTLFIGATALTAVVDNAALTFLGTQVQGLNDASKYALVAGAVAGGGLTVMANAPNPAGFSILRSSFGPEGISPLNLFIYAIIPTITAMICFWAA